MDRTRSYWQDGRTEGIMIMLQELSVKDGYTITPTRDYVVEKLTELNLTKYIDDVLAEYYIELSY